MQHRQRMTLASQVVIDRAQHQRAVERGRGEQRGDGRASRAADSNTDTDARSIHAADGDAYTFSRQRQYDLSANRAQISRNTTADAWKQRMNLGADRIIALKQSKSAVSTNPL